MVLDWFETKVVLGNALKCKKCDSTFESKKNLKEHIYEIHPTNIKCLSCEKTFQKNCELETHIKTSHKEMKKYDCDKYDQKFVLKYFKTQPDMH